MLTLMLAMLLAPAQPPVAALPDAHPDALVEPEPDEAAPEPLVLDPGITIQRDIRYTERDGVPGRRNSLDIHRPAAIDPDEPLPILIFIHGGGWSIGDKSRVGHKPAWAAGHGWVLVSVNYRLSPDVMHPEHARDVAAAVAWVRANAGSFNGDPARIALMGHSAGAHLAAIVASDESLLGEHGLAPSDLAGVVLLDGAGYNLPQRMRLPAPGRVGEMYRDAFGTDPKVWELASPTLQAKPGDTLPPLFCVHAGQRLEARIQGRDIVRAWRATGADAILHHAPEKDHMTINRDLGAQGDPDSEAVAGFLSGAFRRHPSPTP